MLARASVLLSIIFAVVSAQLYTVPDAKLEALKPKGLRVSIPDEPGIELFAFHANINKELKGVGAGQLSQDVTKSENGRWVYENERVRLKVGDILYYWLYVQVDGLGYQKLDLKWTVTELVDTNTGGTANPVPPTDQSPGPNLSACEKTATLVNGHTSCNFNLCWTELVDPNTGDTASPVPPTSQPPGPTQSTCEKTATLVNGRTSCKGQLIFEEHFDTLDTAKWERDIHIANSPDFEFVAYTSDADNCFVRNGNLHLKPALTVQKYDENFITQGTLQLSGCTGLTGSPECSKEAQRWDIIPPVLSARISTRRHFSFCYGRVEIRAKLPAGDWIFPEVWLEPKDNWYGREYLSGRVQLAMARGNKELFPRDQPEKHIGERRLEVGCRLGVEQKVHTEMKSWESTGQGWCNDFHIYSLTWTQDGMTFQVDGQTVGVMSPPAGGFGNLAEFSGSQANPWAQGTKMAPFDKEFFLTLGIGVGGIQEFPDNCSTVLSGAGIHPKPWRNTQPQAMLQFWRDQINWEPTWSGDNSALQVDYVKVWAL